MGRKRASQGSCSRKRTNEESPLLSNEPKRRRFTLEKRDDYEQELPSKDTHCWICHSNQLVDEAWLFWPCCPRIYHLKCLNEFSEYSNTTESETTCPECTLECVDGTKLLKPVPRIKLKELLLSVIQKYLDDEKKRKKPDKKNADKIFKLLPVFVQWPDHEETDLIKVVDFTRLIKNIHNDSYSKTSEFFSDVKWIRHNCHLLYGSQSTVTKDAGKLVQLIKADLLDIEACHDCCYLGSKTRDFFLKLCNPPHEIIWAQISGHQPWPAKCLKQNLGNVYVKFFGTHQIGKLSVSKCHFISKIHPNGAEKEPKTKCYRESKEELEEYVALYEEQGESFRYYPKGMLFKPGQENEGIELNYEPETASIPDINPSHSSDDLRLGADFSNSTLPPESSDDQMQARIPADESNYPDSASEAAAIRAAEKFFHVVGFPVSFTNHTFSSIQDMTRVLIYKLWRFSRSLPDSVYAAQIEELQNEINSLRRNESHLMNVIAEERSKLEKQKKTFEDDLAEQQAEILALKDRVERGKMLLKNLSRSDFCADLRRKNVEYEQMLLEKNMLLEKCEDDLNLLKTENKDLNAKLHTLQLTLQDVVDAKDSIEKLSRETQTYLECQDFCLQTDFPIESDIMEAKKKSHCYVCVIPANIQCCLNASYCSKTCQKKDEKRHKESCVKEKDNFQSSHIQTRKITQLQIQELEVTTQSTVSNFLKMQ